MTYKNPAPARRVAHAGRLMRSADSEAVDKRLGDRIGSLESRVGDIENRIGGLENRVGGLETRIEHTEENLTQQIQEVKEILIAHDRRIGTLEAHKS